MDCTMKRVIETSETLGLLETPEGQRELCASATGSFDESAGLLAVDLEAFLRNVDLVTKERRFSADWLPKPETARERVSMEEASAVAREIFHNWVRRVRDSSPSLQCH